MADAKISALTEQATLEDTNEFVLADSGASKRVTWANLKAQALADHLADSADAHDASAISILDSGNDFTATDVEGALAELQSDHETDAQNLADHIADSSAAHAASAISFSATGSIAATDVQAAVAEVASEAATNLSTHESDTTSVHGIADTSALYRSGGADVALADGGTGASLSDPNADRIMFWDDSGGAVTWLVPGTGLTITGTTIDASGGSPWDLVVDESGASFSNWANDGAASWASNGTEFHVTPGSSTGARARYTPLKLGPIVRIELEAFFDSTGLSVSTKPLVIGLSNSSSGGPAGGLVFDNLNPSSSGKAYAESLAASGYTGPAATFNTDTWIALVIEIAGNTISITKSGTKVWTTSIAPTAGGTYDSLVMYAYQNKVKVRNLKVYEPAAP